MGLSGITFTRVLWNRVKFASKKDVGKHLYYVTDYNICSRVSVLTSVRLISINVLDIYMYVIHHKH
jgi:hypothetical protein